LLVSQQVQHVVSRVLASHRKSVLKAHEYTRIAIPQRH
jgi:hypothetical protein